MDYSNSFKLISNISRKAKITCILIGGFAVNYYKVSRQTVDVDFMITKEAFDKIMPELKSSGYKIDYSQAVFTRLTNTKAGFLDIDFMFVDKDTLDKILKEAREISIAGEKFLVPALNHIIALKLHAIKYNPKVREYKDLSDIINMIRINNLDYKDKDFRELCLKYGTEELYKKIINALEL